MIVPLSTQNRDTGSSSNHPEKTDAPKPRLLDQVRDTIRRKHYSIRTEQSYIDWIKRFIYFHDKQHPRDLTESHITEFLNFLAVQKKVASSTQNQALCALVFLYREVIKKDLVQAKRPGRLSVVFTWDSPHIEYPKGAGLFFGRSGHEAFLSVPETLARRRHPVDWQHCRRTAHRGRCASGRDTGHFT